MTSQLPPSPEGHGEMAADGDVRTREGLHIEARSLWRLGLHRFLRHRLAITSLVVFVAIVGASLGADWVAPYGFEEITGLANRQLPPSAEHWFGTDEIGRDYFSRVLYGTRTSVTAALIVAVVSTAIGSILGVLAGYYRGWVDNLIMRLVDFLLAVPFLAILLVLSAFLGTREPMIVAMIIAVLVWTSIARVVRGNVLSLREKEYVEAAKASGAGDLRIMFRHVLPNTLSPIVVNATLVLAVAILLESALSFLGFGIQRPFPALGTLIADAQPRMLSEPWLVILPGVVIVALCLCINFIGDGLRDALDPTQQRK